MAYPVRKLDACAYNELCEHTPVLNNHTLEEFVWIYVSPYVAQKYDSLYQFDELSPSKDAELTECPISGFIEKDNICWYKVNSTILSRRAGQHTYRMSLVNTTTNETCMQYFSYVYQDDTPERPYLYMDNKNCHYNSEFPCTGCQSCCNMSK